MMFAHHLMVKMVHLVEFTELVVSSKRLLTVAIVDLLIIIDGGQINAREYILGVNPIALVLLE